MSRDDFYPRFDYEGDASAIAFEFDFKIEELSQLKVIVLDDDGALDQDLTGEDTDYIDNVDFDAVEGGGTVTLQAVLPEDYRIIILLANDMPTQPVRFRSHRSFSLRAIEMALDWLGGAIQRLAYLAQGSLRLHDAIEREVFDMTLPLVMPAGYIPRINEDADGWDFIDPAEALGLSGQEDFAVTDGQAATELTDVLVDSVDYRARLFTYIITRGTTVFSSGTFALHYRNTAWYVVMGTDNRDDASAAHGVTFTVSGTTVAQLLAALDTGAGDGVISLKWHSYE